jgi:bifunctional ADP-heptose synthase (sugar kinase/adenylyltransferase)
VNRRDHALGLTPRELLVALDDDIGVQSVQFHQVRPPPGLARYGREEAWLAFRRIVVSAGPRGMFLRRGQGGFRAVCTQARHAIDVCGAGDQVLATLGCATASGVELVVACELANRAAGLSVMRRGAKPVLLDELRAAIV